ncbi:GntR family transcriptional regulator [Leptolyngbya sp. AN02str]|uniref:GntR family transcriptional regulator n=1 Tax=Leptolyngbya sp. AN02str TaxID=3423363 RepID=UPI003D317136
MALSSQSVQRGKSLHEQAYEALRMGILSGELAPGDRLIETQLAQRLQVSRTPLREALRQLQREGLATADTSGGLRVTTISAEDATQLYDCRLALEQLAVAGACEHATATQLQQLENYVEQAEKLGRSQSKPDNLQLLDLDYQFHHLIAESSGNQRLVFLLEQVFDAMALLRIQTLCHNPQVLDIRLEHRQIYEAIAQRNTDAATEAIQTHLVSSKARVVQEIQSLTHSL